MNRRPRRRITCIMYLSLAYTFSLVSAQGPHNVGNAHNNLALTRLKAHNRQQEEPRQERMEELRTVFVSLQVANPACQCTAQNICISQCCCLFTCCFIAQYVPSFRVYKPTVDLCNCCK